MRSPLAQVMPAGSRRLLYGRLLYGCLLCGWLLCGLSCGPALDPTPVRIAVSCPAGFVTGREMIAGIELALEEVGGTVQGRRVELRIFDVANRNQQRWVSEEAEVRAAREAAADPAVLGYIGPMFSGQAKLSIPILNQAGVAQVSPAASWPGLTRAGFDPGEPGIYYPTGRRTFYRVIANDERQVIAAADWAIALGFKRFYILEGESSYARGMAGIFRERVLDFEITVVGHDRMWEIPITAAQLESYPARVATARPDLIFFSGDFQTEGEIDNFQVLAAALKGAPEAAVMTHETLSNAVLLERTEGILEHSIFGVSGAPPPLHSNTPEAADFVRAFQKRYDRQPGTLGGLAYEAAHVLLEAMEDARSLNREDVLDALGRLETPKKILMDWRLDPAGDRQGAGVVGFTVRNGEWTFARMLDEAMVRPREP